MKSSIYPSASAIRLDRVPLRARRITLKFVPWHPAKNESGTHDAAVDSAAGREDARTVPDTQVEVSLARQEDDGENVGNLVTDSVPAPVHDWTVRWEGGSWVCERGHEPGKMAVDPDTVPVCPKCGKQDAWESVTGRWWCMLCDPPIEARRLRERASRFRT